MLQITVMPVELWDEEKEEFIAPAKEQILTLEHSLVSLSKWESKWCKPFLVQEPKTSDETLDYIKSMTITKNVNPIVYTTLSKENINTINEYIDLPMTATTFAKDSQAKKNRDIITAEIIYYWMIAATIPFECEKWHLNRLLTLIRVCDAKNQPPKKMGKQEIMSRNAEINAARRKQYNTKG